jgi:hypothetical protein
VKIARIALTNEALAHLFAGRVLRFVSDDLDVQIEMDEGATMKDEIERAMLALLPTSPTVN